MTFDDIRRAIQDTQEAHLLNRGATGAVLYETEELFGTDKPWTLAETIAEVVNRLRSSPSVSLAKDIGSFFCRSTESILVP